MSYQRRAGLHYLAILTAVAVLGTGCGQAGGTRKAKRSTAATRVHVDTPTIIPADDFATSGSSATSQGLIPLNGTPTQTGTTGSPSNRTEPLYSFPIRAVGYTSVTVEVEANKILRARFIPGIQDTTVENSGFAPHYSKLGVYIKVGKSSQPTAMLNNGLSGSLQESSILTFSSAIPHNNCVTGSTSDCRETVTVEVTKPNYDYWCYNFPYGFSMGTRYYQPYEYCPHTQVHSTHPWNGQLVIETDDTVSLE